MILLGLKRKISLIRIIGLCFATIQCAQAFHAAAPSYGSKKLCPFLVKSPHNTHRGPFQFHHDLISVPIRTKPIYVSVSTPDIPPQANLPHGHDAPVASREITDEDEKEIDFVRKFSAISYIASMCIALPISLLPISFLSWIKVISKKEREHSSLCAGEFCSRNLLNIMPFVKLNVIPQHEENPVPSIWCINHTSMLDVFMLLAADKKLRGDNRRPIKFIYWKGLESNPITKLLFQMSGFIPVEMADNGNGNPNEYDISSFKSLLRELKKAFDDGFDIGLFPEGQPNPTTEEGLQPVYPGAYTLAKMSKRPIRMVGLHGIHNLWHPEDSLLEMKVSGEEVIVCAYPSFLHDFENGDEFVETFKAIVGSFGATGEILSGEEMKEWLDGRAWKKKVEQKSI